MYEGGKDGGKGATNANLKRRRLGCVLNRAEKGLSTRVGCTAPVAVVLVAVAVGVGVMAIMVGGALGSGDLYLPKAG